MATTPVFSQQEPMNSMIRKKYITLEDEPARSEGVQCATGEEWKTITNSSRKNEVTGQSKNDAQWWMDLVLKVKSNAIKNNIA